MGTYTGNKNLYKPAVGERDWGTLVNSNFDTIDLEIVTWQNMWFGDFSTIIGNEFTFGHSVTQNFGMYWYQNTAALGDKAQIEVILGPGDYTMYVHGIEGTDRGTVRWYLDSVQIGTDQDWYNVAGETENIVKSFNFTCTSNGPHVLMSEIVSKNAASSSYKLTVGRIQIRPEGL